MFQRVKSGHLDETVTIDWTALKRVHQPEKSRYYCRKSDESFENVREFEKTSISIHECERVVNSFHITVIDCLTAQHNRGKEQLPVFFPER